MKRRKILFVCFGLSLFIHGMAVFCFQKYSLWFSSPQTAQPSENWLSLVDKKERDEILKTTFDPMAKEEEKVHLQPVHEEVASLSISSKSKNEELEPENINLFQLNLPMNEPLLAGSVLPTFTIPSQTFNLLDHLPKELIVPISAKPKPPVFLPLPTKTTLELSARAPKFEDRPANLIFFADNIDFDLSGETEKAKTASPIPLPNLPKLPTLAELDTSSCSESFDADLVFLPKGEEEKGYIFALTLIPRPDLNLPKLKQNITFLIDRSNSIQQNRLSASKAAIHKALGELSPDDSFNIIAFDGKMDKMAPSFLPCTGKSYAAAEAFLEKVQLGSFFSTSDLYKPLFLTVPGQVGQDEIHTAILLTDGESLAKKTAYQSILSDWTRYNGGKVALFAMGMNDLHAAKLDLATSFNRGKFISAPTNRGMKRKLLKLLKTIQNPVAKNISCHAISRSPTGKISLFPKAAQMPHLYLDQPYVILGEIDALDDFILFVQGRLKDRWLNIKKTITFLNARKGSSSLKEELALQKANQLYEQYLHDDNPKHIADAKELLEPFDLQAAF